MQGRKIKLPTFSQMQNPDLVPDEIKDNLKKISLWETDPNNLFRITWKNEPVPKGGGFGNVNYMVIPSELSGVRAKIIALTGKWFPTGAQSWSDIRLPDSDSDYRTILPFRN